jgi:hypothetical protein
MASAEIATGRDIRAVGDSDRAAAQLMWAAIDSPWVHSVDRDKFLASIRSIESLHPAAVFSTRLPPAVGINDELFSTIARAADGPEFVGPDQRAIEALLATFEPPAPGPMT